MVTQLTQSAVEAKVALDAHRGQQTDLEYGHQVRSFAVRFVVCLTVTLFLVAAYPLYGSAQTITVAACDSLPSSIAKANFKANCFSDQDVINQALAACPAGGCSVMLYEGHYDIRAVPGTLGGILITKSNVHLYGVGAATQLRLADNQKTNVIRIVGDGLQNVTVSDMSIDGNFNNNINDGERSYEFCGVRGTSSSSNPLQNITVEHMVIKDSYRLNVYLWGTNVKIINNILGDARSDSAECITGPCEISGNYVEIASASGYGLGSDTADTVTITGNIVRVLRTGSISEAIFRTWGGRYRNVLANNQVIVDPGGFVNMMFDIRGYMNIITGNVVRAQDTPPRATSSINGGSVVTGNFFGNSDLSFKDTTTGHWPILVDGNQFFYSSIVGTLPSGLVMGSNAFFPALAPSQSPTKAQTPARIH